MEFATLFTATYIFNVPFDIFEKGPEKTILLLSLPPLAAYYVLLAVLRYINFDGIFFLRSLRKRFLQK